MDSQGVGQTEGGEVEDGPFNQMAVRVIHSIFEGSRWAAAAPISGVSLSACQ